MAKTSGQGGQLGPLLRRHLVELPHQLLQVVAPLVDILDRLVVQQPLDPDERLAGRALQLVDLVEEPFRDRPGEHHAATRPVGRRAGNDVCHHAPQEAAGAQFHPGIGGNEILAVDLQVHGHAVLRDPEGSHPPDIHPVHLHGVSVPDSPGVRHHRPDDVAPAEKSRVGEGEERGQDGHGSQDDKDAHPQLAIVEARGGEGGQRFLFAPGFSLR